MINGNQGNKRNEFGANFKIKLSLRVNFSFQKLFQKVHHVAYNLHFIVHFSPFRTFRLKHGSAWKIYPAHEDDEEATSSLLILN